MNVVTWNTQGADADVWSTGVRQLFRCGADLVCLQGCPHPPPGAVRAAAPRFHGGPEHLAAIGGSFLLWKISDFPSPTYALVFHAGATTTGARIDLAIATLYAPKSPDSTHAPSRLLYLANTHEGGRPALGLRLPYNGVAIDLYTVQTLAPGGPDGPGLLNRLRDTDTRWFIAGTFNRNSSDWPGHPLDVGLCTHHDIALLSGGATCHDYAFIRPGPAVTGRVFGGLIVSDHFPVIYSL